MTIGNDGTAPSRQPEGTTSDGETPPRRWPARRIGIGIAVLILIIGGIYLYAGRETDNDITGGGEPGQTNASKTTESRTTESRTTASNPAENKTAENKPAPAPQPQPTSSPSVAQAPSASPPPSASQPAAPAAAQSAPNQTAQAPAPAPAEQPAAQPQPMRQQSTNLPEPSEMMSVRVSRANIRSAPSLSARVVVTAHKGAKLKVLGRSGKWVQVEADGRNGWINGKMLDPQ